MRRTASIIRCLALHRYGFRSAGFAGALCACALGITGGPVAAQVLVKDLQPVSMQFSSAAQDGIRAHQAQVRARQVRVRQSKNRSALPRITNDLTMSSERASIPLQLRKAQAAAKPGLKSIEASNLGVINSFIRGDLHTDTDNISASGLSTADLTVGSDYRVSEKFMFGVAAGRLANSEASGTTLSAFITLQPLDRIFLDMSLSYGIHSAQDKDALRATTRPHEEGISRAFSMSLNHPRQIGEWFWSPYSRFDHIVTDVDARSVSTSSLPVSFGLSAMSIGSTAATTWTTPFGAVRPMVMVELQKEVITVAGIGTTSSVTQGIVGFGMSTKVSRDMSAFAESRYQSDLAETLDRQMRLGVKFAF